MATERRSDAGSFSSAPLFPRLFALRFAAVCMLLQALPWLMLLGQKISVVAFATESVGYRYFHSYRILHGEKSAIWEAQGQTLGVFHHGLNILLTMAGVEDLRLRLEWFGYGTLAVGTLLWGAVCYRLARLPGSAWQDRWLPALAGLFAWYGCFWGRASAMLPDYYSWEIIATVGAAGLFLSQLRRPEPTPLLGRAALLGALAGLMAGIKFTLLPAALLPVLPWFMTPGSRSKLTAAGAAWIAGAGLALGLILSAYYLFDFAQLGVAIQAWRSFVAAPGAEPGFVTRLLNPFGPIVRPWDDHQFVPFIGLLWLVALGLFVASARPPRIEMRYPLLLAGFFISTAVLHGYAVLKRPAETTLFETALFFAVSGALLLCSSPQIPSLRRAATVWLGLLAGWCIFSVVRYAPTAGTYARLRETSQNTWALHHWLTASGRPLLIVFPDNRYVANTVEECLMKGFSDTPSWNITQGQSLLDRIAPNRRFVQQLDAIPPGHIIMWTEIPGQPPITDLFPALKSLEARASTWTLPRDYVGLRQARTAVTEALPPTAAPQP